MLVWEKAGVDPSIIEVQSTTIDIIFLFIVVFTFYVLNYDIYYYTV